MKYALRLTVLVLAIASLAACSTSKDGTWIGENVDETVDSSKDDGR